tara:strand:- start:864 stop:1538 length:675 start_codon:yes stop_codon:yes gene_type:complete
MTIHYHGTPINPHREIFKMAGKHFCVSFTDPRQLDWCLKNGQSVMIDNGAFSMFTQGVEVNWNDFYEFLEPVLCHPHWAIIPDVIDGTEEENDKLIDDCTLPEDLSAAVWHLNEPFDRLEKLADSGRKVCFGSSGEYWQVGSAQWCRRVDQAFNVLVKRGPLPWVHMLRGMAVSHLYPFASVDSTNVARNFKSNHTCPEYMARRIDAIQGPNSWYVKETQGELI